MKNKWIIFLSLHALAIGLLSCEADKTQKIEQKNWELVWSDEFNREAGELPNSNNWTYDIGASGWGNQELQYYTNRPELVNSIGEKFRVFFGLLFPWVSWPVLHDGSQCCDVSGGQHPGTAAATAELPADASVLAPTHDRAPARADLTCRFGG